jgi:hypothetical protein
MNGAHVARLPALPRYCSAPQNAICGAELLLVCCSTKPKRGVIGMGARRKLAIGRWLGVGVARVRLRWLCHSLSTYRLEEE